MNINEIKRLVKLVESSNIEELEVQEEGFQIRVTKNRKEPASIGQLGYPQPVQQTPHYVQQEAPVHEAHAKVESKSSRDDLVEICSPMVGTFYRAPAPDAAPYVKEGDTIQQGKILCIIEAMKLMNEIEAEISGKIVKILIENTQPVEYNQPLFLIEKS